MRVHLSLRAMTLAVLAGLAAHAAHAAAADLPGTIKTAHPYLYATSTDLDALKTKLKRPAMPSAGTMVLRFVPGRQGTYDANSAILFGSLTDTVGRLNIRYMGDTVQGTKLMLRFDGGSALKYYEHTVTNGDDVKIAFRYKADGSVEGFINDVAIPQLNGPAGTWDPAMQKYYFVGRKDQKILEFTVKDAAGNEAWNGADLDWNLGGAYYGFIEDDSPRLKNQIALCDFNNMPSGENVCNVATAGRVTMLDAAKQLALAYRLTGSTDYVDAARQYVNLIVKMEDYEKGGVKTGVATNGEWSMSGRVAALGVLYDWFHDKFDATEKARIREAIVKTIRADSTALQDLISMTCGSPKLTDAPTLDCNGEPDIDKYYITGHHASAMTSVAIALLAIARDAAAAQEQNVMPLLGRIYTHLVDGMLPARDYISQDGGIHTLFAYGNSGEIIERLILWRRAFDTPNNAPIEALNAAWAAKVIEPFIYGLRADGAYPKTGDDFNLRPTEKYVGFMALTAATAPTNDKGTATEFYSQQIQGRRLRTSQLGLWDALYFPGTKTAAVPLTPGSLELAARYRIAGNVFMRDTWDFAKATLLDFKSTSFSSENHQHLDQNSFALFYKAPLLVDSGYGDYETRHWYNYYRRTIAHNTMVVYDKNETYSHKAGTDIIVDSNDGGQWYRGALYPTLDEIVNGDNKLDGIDAFENRAKYAYVRANAGKSYLSPSGGAARLDPVDGFRRHIVYLRADGKPPTILVYDRVHSLQKLPAVSLLHTVKRPLTGDPQVRDDAIPSRYKVNSTVNKPLKVVNGDGMVTIEPLLPQGAHIHIVGGAPDEGSICQDVGKTETSTDCRFTVRTGANEWRNYPTQTGQDTVTSDFGAWRVEISSVADNVEQGNFYQYFLNVLRVADDDKAPVPVANKAVLLPGNDKTHAVRVDDGTTVVFATSFGAVPTFRWKPQGTASKDAKFIAVGAVPGVQYTRRIEQTGEFVLEQGGTGSESFTSSADGVINNL